MIKLNYLEITQPIGTFYISKMSAKQVGKSTQVNQRTEENYNSVQREDSEFRINEIKDYCSDPDATFPTPIIISIYDDANIQLHENQIIIENENEIIGEILDGQHRIKGILKSDYAEKFDLPIIFMFNLTEEEKAYVFSIINSKQTKVSMSLIYDLFELSNTRSPQKTIHEIARSFNNDPVSPYYNRLKMLGKKTDNQDYASLSQGTFVKYLLKLISKKPDEDFRNLKQNIELKTYSDLPMRTYFLDQEDQTIYKILLNCFKALANTFEEEWHNPDKYILSKTTGFGAVIKSFNNLYFEGDIQNDLSEDYFKKCFQKLKNKLKYEKLELTSEYFPSNEQTQSKLSKMIIDCI